MFDGSLEARWWNQAVSPESARHPGSRWRALTDDEVRQLLAS